MDRLRGWIVPGLAAAGLVSACGSDGGSGPATKVRAVLSSESQLQPDLLTSTAQQLAVAASVTGAQVDSSILEWTQLNVSHMAGAYVIAGNECLPAVVRQTSTDEWLITAVPEWTDPEDLASLVAGASSVVISDSTQVNPSRLPTCFPGG